MFRKNQYSTTFTIDVQSRSLKMIHLESIILYIHHPDAGTMCINPQLKIVPNSFFCLLFKFICEIYTCWSNICQKGWVTSGSQPLFLKIKKEKLYICEQFIKISSFSVNQ